MHSQIEEQYFQEIENSSPKSLQEGNLSNLCEGGGETGQTEEPRFPLGIVQPLSSPDKGSAVKIIQNKAEEPEEIRSPHILVQQGNLIIPKKGSAVKSILAPSN